MSLPDSKGFFLMWRCLSDHKVMRRHGHYIKLWMWILSTAAHRGNASERTPIGIVRSSWSSMARTLSYEEEAGRTIQVSPSTARTIVEWFAAEGMVRIESVTRGRNAEAVLSVCNWERWQDIRNGASERQSTDQVEEMQADSSNEEYSAEHLLALWGPLKSRTPDKRTHLSALNSLHTQEPKWSQSDVVAMIENVQKYGGDGEGLEFIKQRGPSYLIAKIKRSGQQVAEYALQFKPFGENKNGKNRQSRVNNSLANLDAVLFATSTNESRGHDNISRSDGAVIQRIQLGSNRRG